MKHIARTLFLCALLFAAAASFLPSQQGLAEKRALSLRECLVQALANNLSLTVEAFNPAIEDAAAAEAREEFLPEFGASFIRQKYMSLGVWGLQGTSYPYRYSYYDFSLSQKIATGTTLALSVENFSSTTGQKYTIINPSYEGTLRMIVTQPLLKGFGPKANRAAAYQAERQKEIATAVLKAKALEVVYDAEQAYWNLYSALENLKVQESSLAQSREVLKRAREGERIGNQSALDVLTAETSAAGWEDGVVSSRLLVEKSESALRKILNLPPAAPDSVERPALSDAPSVEKIETNYDEALAAALVHRPEIVEAEKQISIAASRAGYAANQVLPQLDLKFSGWSQGQSGIKYLYENDDPINGAPLGQIVGSRWDAFKQALKGTYKSWYVALDLTVPLASIFSRAGLRQARLQQQQSLAALETEKQTAAFEVAGALKELRNAEIRIQSTTASRVLQEKHLAAQLQRYQLGLVDIQWLFEYQRQLASARESEIQAAINYRLAAARLEQATGTTLEKKGLTFRDYAF